MAIISSQLLLSTLASFNLFVAYYLLTSPQTLASHHTVLILGGSIRLPAASSSMYSSSSPAARSSCADAFAHGNPGTSLAALFLGFFAASDLVAIIGLANELVYHAFWGMMVPVRLAGIFVLLAWLYLSARPAAAGAAGQQYDKGGAGLLDLKNGLVFTWGFVTLSALFWAFSTLRQERHDLAIKQAKKEEDRVRLEGQLNGSG